MLTPKNAYNQTFFKSTFEFKNNKINQKLENVGFRIKGGASRQYAKKSYKFSFT
jgi:hypothetical protein